VRYSFRASIANRHHLAVGQRYFRVLELVLRPFPFGILVVGDTSDPVLLPQLAEEGGTIPFAVEEDHEATEIRIGFQLFSRWLPGNLLQ